MIRRPSLLGCLLIVLIVGSAGLRGGAGPSVASATAASTGPGPPVLDLVHGISLRRAGELNTPVYYAGSAIEGLPLTVILPEYVSGRLGGASFIYGGCAPAPCAAPIEIQVWPACARNLSLYESHPGPVIVVPEYRTVRSVPAAFFEGGARLELQTGRSTIVVFAPDATTALAASSALRGLNVSVDASDELPRPVPGAVGGDLTCV